MRLSISDQRLPDEAIHRERRGGSPLCPSRDSARLSDRVPHAATWPTRSVSWCRGWGSNPHDSFESQDFKSCASASFATPARCSDSIVICRWAWRACYPRSEPACSVRRAAALLLCTLILGCLHRPRRRRSSSSAAPSTSTSAPTACAAKATSGARSARSSATATRWWRSPASWRRRAAPCRSRPPSPRPAPRGPARWTQRADTLASVIRTQLSSLSKFLREGSDSAREYFEKRLRDQEAIQFVVTRNEHRLQRVAIRLLIPSIKDDTVVVTTRALDFEGFAVLGTSTRHAQDEHRPAAGALDVAGRGHRPAAARGGDSRHAGRVSARRSTSSKRGRPASAGSSAAPSARPSNRFAPTPPSLYY